MTTGLMWTTLSMFYPNMNSLFLSIKNRNETEGKILSTQLKKFPCPSKYLISVQQRWYSAMQFFSRIVSSWSFYERVSCVLLPQPIRPPLHSPTDSGESPSPRDHVVWCSEEMRGRVKLLEILLLEQKCVSGRGGESNQVSIAISRTWFVLCAQESWGQKFDHTSNHSHWA